MAIKNIDLATKQLKEKMSLIDYDSKNPSKKFRRFFNHQKRIFYSIDWLDEVRNNDYELFILKNQIILANFEIRIVERQLESMQGKFKGEVIKYLESLKEFVIYVENLKESHQYTEYKLTKELAKEYRDEVKLIDDDYQSNEGRLEELYLWFIESVSNGYYELEEAIEIAKILKQVDELEV
jgi:hypothetical protein